MAETPPPPDLFDVLEATFGLDTRILAVDGARVVRTPDRQDHAAGNALHVPDGVAGPDQVVQLARRFPSGSARLVARVAGGDVDADLRRSWLDVLVHADTVAAGERSDLVIAAPGDDRAWHGLTVLHRHAAGPGEDRERGAADELLRWWVGGLQRLVGAGRARVLRAERFGTPVGAVVLHWAPAAAVPEGRAGLAVVTDLVVHPAHRRLGIARALVDAVVVRHLADFPRAQVVGLVDRHDPRRPSPPRGWAHHGTLQVLTRHAGRH